MKKLKYDTTKKAEVLAVLYNAAKPLGLGILFFTKEDMKVDEASELLKTQKIFDYLKGRVMKLDLSGDEIDPWLYDRDNGQGACKKILKKNNLLK